MISRRVLPPHHTNGQSWPLHIRRRPAHATPGPCKLFKETDGLTVFNPRTQHPTWMSHVKGGARYSMLLSRVFRKAALPSKPSGDDAGDDQHGTESAHGSCMAAGDADSTAPRDATSNGTWRQRGKCSARWSHNQTLVTGLYRVRRILRSSTISGFRKPLRRADHSARLGVWTPTEPWSKAFQRCRRLEAV